MATSLQLSSEPSAPARLNRTNLHPYRLKVKELRYVLQMSEAANHQQFVDSLGNVKRRGFRRKPHMKKRSGSKGAAARKSSAVDV